jgi:hypothetical protein
MFFRAFSLDSNMEIHAIWMRLLRHTGFCRSQTTSSFGCFPGIPGANGYGAYGDPSFPRMAFSGVKELRTAGFQLPLSFSKG